MGSVSKSRFMKKLLSSILFWFLIRKKWNLMSSVFRVLFSCGSISMGFILRCGSRAVKVSIGERSDLFGGARYSTNSSSIQLENFLMASLRKNIPRFSSSWSLK